MNFINYKLLIVRSGSNPYVKPIGHSIDPDINEGFTLKASSTLPIKHMTSGVLSTVVYTLTDSLTRQS
jgi:hypothetical protein